MMELSAKNNTSISAREKAPAPLCDTEMSSKARGFEK